MDARESRSVMSKKLPKPLVVIPVFIHRAEHIGLLTQCLTSLRDPRRTASEVDIILVDDCSPFDKKSEILSGVADKFDCELFEKPVNTGFAQTANIGLMKAHARGVPAVLLNMDVEFSPQGFECKDWYKIAMKDEGDLVGGKLLYPNGLVQFAGTYYSMLHRYLDHIGRFSPPNMKDVNIRKETPITGALQIIKPQVFDAVGYYDEHFKMAYEDVDFCLKTMLPPEQGGAGLKVIYNPEIVAIHHESVIRGGQKKYSDWHDESWVYFQQKYARVPMTQFVLPIDRDRSKT